MGRSVFKTVEGRSTCLVGSTPTLFRQIYAGTPRVKLARKGKRLPAPNGCGATGRVGPELTETLLVLAAAAVLFSFAAWRERQPKEDGVIRWIPYTGIQFVALLIFILAAAHLVSLWTGTPLIGRFSR